MQLLVARILLRAWTKRKNFFRLAFADDLSWKNDAARKHKSTEKDLAVGPMAGYRGEVGAAEKDPAPEFVFFVRDDHRLRT